MELLEIESLLKLGGATLLGGLIGLEREIHGRPAGLRTNALVCMASALLIIVSRSGALTGLDGPGDIQLNVDPARMSAGIVTGIGFLGAGAILRIRESLVRGLTTAATIWFVATIGISVGLGEWVLAGSATALSVVLLLVFGRFERFIGGIEYRVLEVKLHTSARSTVEEQCVQSFARAKVTVQQTDYSLDNENQNCSLRYALRTRDGAPLGEMISAIAAVDGVVSASIA